MRRVSAELSHANVRYSCIDLFDESLLPNSHDAMLAFNILHLVGYTGAIMESHGFAGSVPNAFFVGRLATSGS